MKDYKLIVSDLDATLLHDDMSLSAKNEKALEEFKRRGILFVPSSGRTLYEIPDSVRKNPNIRYITYSNGTAVYDSAKGEDIISNRITREVAGKIFDVVSDYDVLYTLHVSGHSHIDIKNTADENFPYYQINDYYKTLLLKSVRVDDIEALGRDTDGLEAAVIFFHDDRELEACQKRLRLIPEITVTSSIGHNIELCSKKAGKGKALSQLSLLLNIPKENVIAIGDNMNDVSMFSEVGLSLCAEGGCSEAKRLADETVCSNDEDIANYVLNSYIKI